MAKRKYIITESEYEQSVSEGPLGGLFLSVECRLRDGRAYPESIGPVVRAQNDSNKWELCGVHKEVATVKEAFATCPELEWQ